ncbi:Fic family protein [Pseudoclavibacter soli]|uniref:Fic family protein n=1 Tax=Pseudoclavibacter soli TaxID=452623 RepID=UPI00048913CD|nr:Fic family protein [Pseudoclavibacter soli]
MEPDLSISAEVQRIADRIRPGTVDRAIWRLQHQKTSLVFNELTFEKNTYTLPQIQTLLHDNITPAGKTAQETEQVIALSEGVDLMISDVRNRAFRLDAAHACELNRAIARADSIEPGVIRGTGNVHSSGTVNVQGDVFTAVSEAQASRAYQRVFKRVSEIPNPLVRAATFAAASTYTQPFLDGNKRTARVMMNGYLLSRGYDAILIPARAEQEYVAAVAELFRTGRTAPYAEFLIRLAQGSSSAAGGRA